MLVQNYEMDNCIVGGNFFGICRFVSPLGECRSDACGSIHFIILPSCPFPLSWKFDQLQQHFVLKYTFTSTSVCTKKCLNDAPCKIKKGQNVRFPKTVCVRKCFFLINWPWFKLPFTQVTKDDNTSIIILTHNLNTSDRRLGQRTQLEPRWRHPAQGDEKDHLVKVSPNTIISASRPQNGNG